MKCGVFISTQSSFHDASYLQVMANESRFRDRLNELDAVIAEAQSISFTDHFS